MITFEKSIFDKKPKPRKKKKNGRDLIMCIYQSIEKLESRSKFDKYKFNKSDDLTI